MQSGACAIARQLPGTEYLQLIQQAEYGEAERCLQEGRVTLTWFDTELRELERLSW